LFKAIIVHQQAITGKVLDVGCGSKPYQDCFPLVSTYIGIDVETSGHDHKNSIVDVFYDGLSIPFTNESFDSVVCFEVLEHVKDPKAILGEVNRVIKDHGSLLISVPFLFGEHEEPYDFQRFTSFGLVKLLKDAGFIIVSLEKTTSEFMAIAQLNILYLSRHWESKIRGFNRIKQYLIIAPLTAATLVIDKLITRHQKGFCNIVVLAKKS
jgi:ubiquinone/menaquinone biosynthesis C-methylase UbiE